MYLLGPCPLMIPRRRSSSMQRFPLLVGKLTPRGFSSVVRAGAVAALCVIARSVVGLRDYEPVNLTKDRESIATLCNSSIH